MTSFVARFQVEGRIGIGIVLSGGIVALISNPVIEVTTGTRIVCLLPTHISLSAQRRSFPPLYGSKLRNSVRISSGISLALPLSAFSNSAALPAKGKALY